MIVAMMILWFFLCFRTHCRNNKSGIGPEEIFSMTILSILRKLKWIELPPRHPDYNLIIPILRSTPCYKSSMCLDECGWFESQYDTKSFLFFHSFSFQFWSIQILLLIDSNVDYSSTYIWLFVIVSLQIRNYHLIKWKLHHEIYNCILFKLIYIYIYFSYITKNIVLKIPKGDYFW